MNALTLGVGHDALEELRCSPRTMDAENRIDRVKPFLSLFEVRIVVHGAIHLAVITCRYMCDLVAIGRMIGQRVQGDR